MLALVYLMITTNDIQCSETSGSTGRGKPRRGSVRYSGCGILGASWYVHGYTYLVHQSLFAADAPSGAIEYGFAHAACGILSGNQWNGWFTTTTTVDAAIDIMICHYVFRIAISVPAMRALRGLGVSASGALTWSLGLEDCSGSDCCLIIVFLLFIGG